MFFFYYVVKYTFLYVATAKVRSQWWQCNVCLAYREVDVFVNALCLELLPLVVWEVGFDGVGVARVCRCFVVGWDGRENKYCLQIYSSYLPNLR